MRLLYSLLFSVVLALPVFANIKLPDVVFPLEITAQKQEKKERLLPPKRLNIDINAKIENPKIKPAYPVDLEPITADIKKEKTFLGIPKEKADFNDLVDYFINGNFLFLEDKAPAFMKKYPKSKYLPIVYYMLGYAYFKTDDLKKSLSYFEKSCNLNSYVKDTACVSGAAVALETDNLENAKKLLKKVNNNSLEAEFLKRIVSILKEDKPLNTVKDINCEEIDISFVNYCRYLKLHYIAQTNPQLFIKKYQPVKNYEKILQILKGFAFLTINDVKNAEKVFKNYLNTYGRADLYSTYPIYGLMIISIKKGNIKNVIDNIGSLEIRDKKLAQKLYIKIGLEYFKKGKYDDALAFFQEALTVYPENKNILKKAIGITAYNAGYYDYAYNIFKQIHEPKYYLYTAFTLLKLKNYPEAEFYLTKAYKEASDNNIKLTALKYLADIYYFKNDDKKLIETLKLIAKYDPDFAANMLGWYFFKKKMYNEAYKAFTDNYMKAVSAFNMGKTDLAYKLIKNNKDRKSLFLKAYIYLKKMNFDKARKILKYLSDGNDEIAKQAGYLYAYSYFSNEEYDKAYKAFKKYAEKYKDTPFGKRALLRMADSLFNMGKEEEAKKIYTEFIEKYSGTKEAIDAAYLLTLLEAKGKTKDENVEKQIENFIKKYPHYPKINLLKIQLAEIYFENNKPQKAIKLLEEVVKTNTPESEQALYKLGYYNYKLGNKSKAKEYFIEYLLKYPQGKLSIPVKQLLATIYEQEGKYEEAIKLYSSLPKTDENIYKIALLYFKSGNYLEAKKNFETLYVKYPKYKSDIAYYLGIIQLKLGNYDEAKRYFLEAIKSSDYKKVAESHYLLGTIYEKEGDLEDALNEYINVIYLYSQDKNLTFKSRIKAAKILKKEGKPIEAACMIQPVKNLQNLDEETKKFISTLPECIKD